MAHRHKVQAFASGGGVEPHNPPVTDAYAGGNSNVAKESRMRKRGGRVHDDEEEERKDGGRVERKAGGLVTGAKSASRADRPGRKGGGRVGADTSPLTSANRSSAQKLAQQH